MNITDLKNQLLSEIKINKPFKLSDSEKETIYYNLAMSYKPFEDENIDSFDLNSLTIQDFIDRGFDEDFMHEDGQILLDKNKIRAALKELPEIDITDEEVEDFQEIYLSRNNQFYILNHNNNYYIINTEGYNYPRYVGRILNYK